MSEAAMAARHAKLRYLGMPLFVLGLLGILAALGLWLSGSGKGGWVLLYVASTGLSLATFGSNNDTAIAYMVRAEGLPDGLRSELEWEMKRDLAGTQALIPTPKTAYAMLLIALTLHALAASRLISALM